LKLHHEEEPTEFLKRIFSSTTGYHQYSVFIPSINRLVKTKMPRSQGTSRKGKPKKADRAAGMGKALQKYVQSFSSSLHSFSSFIQLTLYLFLLHIDHSQKSSK